MEITTAAPSEEAAGEGDGGVDQSGNHGNREADRFRI